MGVYELRSNPTTKLIGNGKLGNTVKKPVVSSAVTRFYKTDGAEAWNMRFMAVLFRGRVYVGTPRHKDAIDLAFAGMTHHTKRRVSNRIADGKEAMLFGTAKGDGTDWEHDPEYQDARMLMYGFD